MDPGDLPAHRRTQQVALLENPVCRPSTKPPPPSTHPPHLHPPPLLSTILPPPTSTMSNSFVFLGLMFCVLSNIKDKQATLTPSSTGVTLVTQDHHCSVKPPKMVTRRSSSTSLESMIIFLVCVAGDRKWNTRHSSPTCTL